jgi:hypothetical protein
MQSDDPQLNSEKRRMQVELVLKDSDLKKNLRLKMELELAIRDMKKKQVQMEFDLVAKTSLMRKVEAEIILLQNEIIKEKHKLAGLGRQKY